MKRSPLRKVATRRTASASDRLQDRNRKQRRNMFLERLEDRSLMATMLWLGGNSQNMSDPLNWVGKAAPVQDDSLVFQAGKPLSVTNDFADGTRFRSITISDGYTISNPLASPNNRISLLEGVNYNSASSAATVSVPLTLAAGASIFSANTNALLTL